MPDGKDVAQQAKNSFIKDAAKAMPVVEGVKGAEKVADNTPDRKNTPNTSKTDKTEGGENQKPANESGNDKKTTNEKDKTEGENTSKEKNPSDETEGRKVTREDNGGKTGSGVETSGEVKETKVEDIKERSSSKEESEYLKSAERSSLYDVNGNYTGGRTRAELDALEYDPAKKAVTTGSKKEARIGLDLEEKGIIGHLERSAAPEAEFIDLTTGKKYDVKSFESTPIGADGLPITSPRKGAFKVQNAMKNIMKEFNKNGNDFVIIDTSKLIPNHINDLKKEIDKAGISDKIIWWSED